PRIAEHQRVRSHNQLVAGRAADGAGTLVSDQYDAAGRRDADDRGPGRGWSGRDGSGGVDRERLAAAHDGEPGAAVLSPHVRRARWARLLRRGGATVALLERCR